MNARSLALVGSLVLICLLGILTVNVAAKQGVDILVVISLVVLGLLGFGVFGALTSPPDD